MNRTVPVILLLLYVVVFSLCAISPYDRAVWWAENIPIMLLVGALLVIYRWHRFSATGYILMSCLIILHTIGGHYTFERVPFAFVTDLFGFSRNHYDRIAHFSVGFYAYPIAEILLARRLVRSKWVLFLFPVFTIFTVASVYEIIEWRYAMSADPAAGIAMLGSQGDVWDAQKDMLADSLGALATMLLFWIVHRKAVADIGSAE